MLSVIFGVLKAMKFANLVNILIEITPNSVLAVNLHSIQNVIQGTGVLVGGYIGGTLNSDS